LRVSTRQDGVEVSIDGVPQGSGPLIAAAGRHTVTARLDGRTQTQKVWIPQQTVVTFDMRPQP
jgi:hypothetical protein